MSSPWSEILGTQASLAGVSDAEEGHLGRWYFGRSLGLNEVTRVVLS